jgi:hypothetical protein
MNQQFSCGSHLPECTGTTSPDCQDHGGNRAGSTCRTTQLCFGNHPAEPLKQHVLCGSRGSRTYPEPLREFGTGVVPVPACTFRYSGNHFGNHSLGLRSNRARSQDTCQRVHLWAGPSRTRSSAAPRGNSPGEWARACGLIFSQRRLSKIPASNAVCRRANRIYAGRLPVTNL